MGVMAEYRVQDVMKGLKRFENGTFDLAFADPPYFETAIGKSTIMGIQSSLGYWRWTQDWLTLAFKKLKWGGHFYITFTLANVWELFNVINRINQESKLDIRYYGTIIWDYKILSKGFRKGRTVFHPWNYWYNYEPMLYLSKGKPHNLNKHDNPDKRGMIWRIRPPHSHSKIEPKLHPTQKPRELFRRILSFSSQPGDMILDCFTGSGTLLLISAQMGRHSVGFDLDPRWKEVFKFLWEKEKGTTTIGTYK